MLRGLSPRAQRLLTVLAQEEGRKSGSANLLPEHVILGLIKSADGIGYEIIKNLKINVLTLQLTLEEGLPTQPAAVIFSDIPPSRRLRTMLDVAAIESRTLRHNYIGTEHFLIATVREEESLMKRFFEHEGITLDDLRKAALAISKSSPKVFDFGASNSSYPLTANTKGNIPGSQQKSQASLLKEFSRDLTEMAKNGEIDPVVGRKTEIQRVIQILSRRNKNNPVLVGEPGVGKTAIVEGLAQAIVSERVPKNLLDKKLLTLDLASVIAGTKYRGEFEERIKRIMKEINEQKNIILFIDELHTIIGAGGAEGTMDASNMLKPALSRGELQCIGATTLKEYRKYFEKDAALERRFQLVAVNEPSVEETELILEGIKGKYEKFHSVKYDDDVIEKIVRFSKRYITDRYLPDKAIDVLDEAGAMIKVTTDERPSELSEIESRIEELVQEKQLLVQTQDYERAAKIRDEVRELREEFERVSAYWQNESSKNWKKVSSIDICKIISMMTGIPVEQLGTSETSRLISMEDEIHKSVIGQDEAVRLVCSSIKRSRAGVSSTKRPMGSFIFLGPTGVGKTLLAKTVAKFLFGSEESLLRIDMSDYMEKHNASRLVGAPPGYVGYEEGGVLTEKVRRNPYSVILLDEIEKAHHDVFNLLLQILEEGELIDSLGHKVNFRNTVIIMTSNAGARQITSENLLGFTTSKDGILPYEQIKASSMSELKNLLNPELINRIDDIVVFNALSHEEVSQIMAIQLKELSERLSEQDIFIDVKPKAKEYLISNGYEPTYGARPMRRLIQREIEDGLSLKIISGECLAGDTVVVECKKEKLHLSIKKKDETLISISYDTQLLESKK